MRIQGLLFAASGALLSLLFGSPVQAADPLETVRAFCQADGQGARLDARLWPAVGPLVAWGLEPAWDRIVLITGYEVRTPRTAGDAVVVDVVYTVAGDITSGRVTNDSRLETHSYRLAAADGVPWPRILGPPPPPHVFESGADAQALATLLDPQVGEFMSASALVWKLLHEAGVVLPYLPLADLARASLLTAVQEPEMGDLVLYYDGSEPYHVGFVEAEGLVVSATLNGGIRRAPIDAFAGDVRYLRLAPGGTRSDAAPTPLATPAPTRRAETPHGG